MVIPDGEWFCPPCQHVGVRRGSGVPAGTRHHHLCSLLQKQLCDKLQEQLQNLDAALKKKERAERRQEAALQARRTTAACSLGLVEQNHTPDSVCARRKERLIYVGISVENIITPSVSQQPSTPTLFHLPVQTPAVLPLRWRRSQSLKSSKRRKKSRK